MTDNETRDLVEVSHDQLLGEIGRMIKSEGARSSDASESADKTKKFLDETKLNNQALGWGKVIIKKLDKKDGETKAMDVIRSMEAILPMLKNHVLGQQSELGFEPVTPVEYPAPTGVDESGDDPETEDFNKSVDDTVVAFDPDADPVNFGGEEA